MKRVSKPLEILLWVYGVGLAGMLIPFTRNIFIAIIPLNLVFAAVFLFFGIKPAARTIYTGLFIFVASFFVEAAGVNTGMIFGSYSYGKALGPGLWNTPLIIGLNWFILIYCTNAIARQLWAPAGIKAAVKNKVAELLFTVIVGSLLMVGYDLLLEPAAIRLDMWLWEGGVIPFRNYSAWFLLSVIFHLIMRIAGEDRLNTRALPLFTVQLVFFTVTDLYFAFFV
jgi:putative membrane protein